MPTIRVRVFGEEIALSVEWAGPSKWVASAEYLGKTYTAEGRTPKNAAGSWRIQVERATG